MMNKFNNIPLDEDTKIKSEAEVSIEKYDVLHQKWFWDGITAESIIFLNVDISDISDEDIEEKVKSSLFYNHGSKVTLKRCESGFTFVNFNFEYC